MTQADFETLYILLEKMNEVVWQRYQRLAQKNAATQELLHPYCFLPFLQYENETYRDNIIDAKLLCFNTHYLLPLYVDSTGKTPPSRDNMTPANTEDEISYMLTLVPQLGLGSIRYVRNKGSFSTKEIKLILECICTILQVR